ncbi:hypothetical protein GQ43DRAFT_202691 [Delitschia confertaspora ATCC 74209]|uniref:Uncharacterized protein n=1 Tax=Delitschia confertaspora ATCC 74209 TaxID=1513339 RepID=A0A9P4JGD5_9PLEO|nr:hypothetical protein GQ43DRAFT_202691 [Delitschia confertaspora ATCC 74209]
MNTTIPSPGLRPKIPYNEWCRRCGIYMVIEIAERQRVFVKTSVTLLVNAKNTIQNARFFVFMAVGFLFLDLLPCLTGGRGSYVRQRGCSDMSQSSVWTPYASPILQ